MKKIALASVFSTFLLLFMLEPVAAQGVSQCEQTAGDYVAPSAITVTMYALTDNGRIRTQCQVGSNDRRYGCTAYCQDGDVVPEKCQTKVMRDPIPYPYDVNPVIFDAGQIEGDYLPDVLSEEMILEAHHPDAIVAQGYAARSYLYFFQDTVPNDIDNSASRQVFLPYSQDSFGFLYGDTDTDVCASDTSKNTLQDRVCNGLRNKEYIAYNATGSDPTCPSRTEFSSDTSIPPHTQTVTGFVAAGVPYPYLLSVEEPITMEPDVQPLGHGRGMSQNGASRWSWGSETYNRNELANAEQWSTAFLRPVQSVVHYYTGVHLRQVDDPSVITTSQFRWNALQISWDQPSIYQGRVLRLAPNTTYSGSILVQNTSTDIDGWECSAIEDYRLVYTLELDGNPVTVNSHSVCDLGRTKSREVPISFTTPAQEDVYSLRFDVHIILNNTIVQRFSEDDPNGNNWFRYGIFTQVGDVTEGVFLPMVTFDGTTRTDGVPTAITLQSASVEKTNIVIVAILLGAILSLVAWCRREKLKS